jgi:hypothetical protein
MPTTKINSQNAPANLQNPRDFHRALLTRLPRQMVKHQRTQDDVELMAWEWQGFCNRNVEIDGDTGLRCLSPSPCNHRRRRVDAVDDTRDPDPPRRRDRECPGSAPDVENMVSGPETSKAEHTLTELVLPAFRQQPRQHIVAGGPLDHESMSFGPAVYHHVSPLSA